VRTLAAAGAVALHALLLAVALVRCSPEVSAKPPPAETHPPGEATLDVRLLPSHDTGDEDMACPEGYRGIGIRTSDGAHVTDVAPGGPADKAGIQTDDVIVNADILWPDRYMVGHKLTLQISRGGRVFPVVVVIRRICTE
jgi:predicted metalloprotease with PDZ domain